MKRPKRRIETEKDEGAGGGDKAWNFKKQSSRSLFPSSSLRQVRIKKNICRYAQYTHVTNSDTNI